MLFCKHPLPPTARNRTPFLVKLYSDSLLNSSGKNCVIQWIYIQHLTLTAVIYHLRRWFLVSAYHFWLSTLIWYSIRADLQPASAVQNPHILLQIPCDSLYLKSFQKYTWNLLQEFSSQRSGSRFLARFSWVLWCPAVCLVTWQYWTTELWREKHWLICMVWN